MATSTLVPCEIEYRDIYIEEAGISVERDEDLCVISVSGLGDGVADLILDRESLSLLLDQLERVEDALIDWTKVEWGAEQSKP